MVLMLVVWLASPLQANAADSGCGYSYTLDQVLAALVAVEVALRADDGVRASEHAEGLQAGLSCLDVVLPRVIVGRTYRAIGAGHVAGEDPDRGRAWLRSAVEVEDTFDFGLEDLPLVHPVRSAYEAIRQERLDQPERVENRSFRVPAYLDGRRIEAPIALPGRPHLLQLDVNPVQSWTIAGADFPEEAFAVDADTPLHMSSTPAIRPRSRPSATAERDSILNATRKTPWEKTPLVVGGVILGVAAGGVYAAALERRQAFDTTDGPGSAERVARLRPVVNRLTVASWALTLAGAGTLAWGIILDGPVGPMPGMRVRL